MDTRTDTPKLRLESFEGPLDLLLLLIQKHKIDIFDIPIATLTDQYLAHISDMESYDMEISSDFIRMASELAYIKSKMLLPVAPKEEDPRKVLVDALLEYQKAKLTAEFLKGRAAEFFDRFTKEPDAAEKAPDYERRHPVRLLTEAFFGLHQRTRRPAGSAVELFDKLKREKHFTVEEKIIFTLRFLFDEKVHSLSSLFDGCRGSGETVALFLALLQLVGTGRVNIIRESGFDWGAPPETTIYLKLIKNLENAK